MLQARGRGPILHHCEEIARNRMNRQDDLLEGEDGRYFAIDKLGTGLGSIATTETLGETIVSFGLPSAPALYLNRSRRAYLSIRDIDPKSLFDRHPTGWWPDDQGPLFDFLEAFATHVVFAHSAVEAFANEAIPEGFQYAVERNGKEQFLPRSEIERWVSLEEKLHSVLPAALSLPSPKGKVTWENYRAIKKIRDRIIHVKTIDRRASGPEDETLWGTMLREHATPFCDYAHAIIGHYKSVEGRRWFRKYPYERRE
jgi:hypothetical protein